MWKNFAHSLDNFEPIDGKLPDSDSTRLQEDVSPLLLHISYDTTGAVRNLIGLIRLEAAYVDPARVRAYTKTIDKNATAVIRARSEVAHKAKRAERATYEMEQRETTQFVLAVVVNTWVRELRDFDSIYTKVSHKDIFAHLQVGCTSRHALNLLALHK